MWDEKQNTLVSGAQAYICDIARHQLTVLQPKIQTVKGKSDN